MGRLLYIVSLELITERFFDIHRLANALSLRGDYQFSDCFGREAHILGLFVPAVCPGSFHGFLH